MIYLLFMSLRSRKALGHWVLNLEPFSGQSTTLVNRQSCPDIILVKEYLHRQQACYYYGRSSIVAFPKQIHA